MYHVELSAFVSADARHTNTNTLQAASGITADKWNTIFYYENDERPQTLSYSYYVYRIKYYLYESMQVHRVAR